MGAKMLVPVEEYLAMSFPGGDCDYLDGEIVERNMSSLTHNSARRMMLRFLEALSDSHPLFPYAEQRMKISATRYRIADIAVYAGAKPQEETPSQPPAIAVEIVSRDDRHVDIVKRLAEYFGWGVPLVWLVDPWTRKLFHYTSAGLSEVRAFELPEYHARIAAEEIFS